MRGERRRRQAPRDGVALALHQWLDAEHAGALGERIHEMRHPPPKLDVAPDEPLDAFFEELLAWGRAALAAREACDPEWWDRFVRETLGRFSAVPPEELGEPDIMTE